MTTNNLKFNKSSRHPKITGDFAEHFALYWLSKHGYESAIIDHVGIDLIVIPPDLNELWGISVKARSRYEGTGRDGISIPNDHIRKVTESCERFKCEPYFCIIADADETIRMFILSMDHLLYLHSPGEVVVNWKMSKKWLEIYRNDDAIKFAEFQYSENSNKI